MANFQLLSKFCLLFRCIVHFHDVCFRCRKLLPLSCRTHPQKCGRSSEYPNVINRILRSFRSSLSARFSLLYCRQKGNVKSSTYFQQSATSCFHGYQWCTIRSSRRPVSKIQFPQYNALSLTPFLYTVSDEKKVLYFSFFFLFSCAFFFRFPFTQDDCVP